MNSSKEIFLIRHGETDYNQKGIIQGKGIDASLNKTGERQAALFYQKYADYPFEIVFTSTLKRTRQTVKSFIEAGTPHQKASELNEINWGDYEGKNPAECNGGYEKIYTEWRSGNLKACAPEGETPLELQRRQKRFLERLKKLPHQKILICMHGRAMRSLLCTVSGKQLSCMDDFPHQNLSLYKLLYQNGAFKITEFNNLGHLESKN